MRFVTDLDAAALESPGEHPVDAPVFCTLTRFGLRSARYLAPTYREFGAVMRAATDAQVPGLLKGAFLVESPTACYSLSLWSQEPKISALVQRHIDAANRVFGRLVHDPERGPELWSTRWRLASVTNNLNWPGLDLRDAILTGTGGDRP